MKTVAIAQARMGSTRAPGKVMRRLGGRPVLRWTVDALRDVTAIDEVVVATSTLPADDVIADYCHAQGIKFWRGPELDVLDRFYGAANAYGADIVLRLTCDCPFLDPQVIAEVIRLREVTGADYASNVSPPSYPDGLDVECFTVGALTAAWSAATLKSDRECVTQYIVRNQDRFKIVNATCPIPGLAKERWVLDTEEDYEFCQALVEKFTSIYHTYTGILGILDKHPEIRKINEKGVRNERFHEDISTEELPEPEFIRSMHAYGRAREIIPFGAQTFSKSHLQFPVPHSPLFVTHADGARVFDVDGNSYVDMVSALLPVVLGYRDPDVDEAIRRQLDKGITFSLSSPLETELAELLIKHIPCAEMVKFGKSGSDVTTAAVRVARAYTGRDDIVTVGGYHGWHDWAVAYSGRDLGVPDHAALNTRPINIHDFLMGEYAGTPAAIIVEPNEAKHLKTLREVCTHRGILLIFDEVITGFRYHMGGAQALFGITPDLACLGKAMANGMPISALVGKREIMQKFQPPDNCFYSGTMFGETLSIAAAIATIKKLERENVPEKLRVTGLLLQGYVMGCAERFGIEEKIKISGHPSRTILTFADDDIKTLFMMEMIRNGVLIINSNNINLCHGKEMKRIMAAYEKTFDTIAQTLKAGDIKERLKGARVSPTPLRAQS